MEFQQLLRFAVEHNASDIHLQAGLPPHLRMGGHLKAVNQPPPGVTSPVRSAAGRNGMW